MRSLTLGVTLTKTTNSSVWDQQAYSNVGFTGGAYASARAASNWAMFGLNTDPTTDANFASIDYAWYTDAANALRIYESNVLVGTFGTWAVGDLLEIIYDNANVKYYKNGALIRTVARAAGATFFFDSSFYSASPVFGSFTNVKFGPDSALRNIAYTASAGVALSYGEFERLTGSAFNIHVQSESQDADGTWQTHNTLQGRDWQTAFKYRGDADTPYVAGSIELARADRTLSMAPLVTGSLINRNAAAAYAPFLDVGRRVRVKTAITPQFVAPLAGDYRYVFDGYIDKVGIGGRDDNAIVIECRDLGALLIDTDIEVVRQYGSGAGVAVETVMQQILDDNLGAGAVTLYTPTTPNWFIHEFSQKLQSTMEALRTLAKQIGYEIRYVYDANNVLRLTFYAPDRAKIISDYVIGPTVYWDVTKLDLDIVEVRNAWTVEFIDRATGNKLTSVATSAPSIAQYKRRPAKIAYGYTSNIDSITEADKMTAAAVADTAFPKALEVVDLNYWPLVDVADFITLLQNGEHYDTDQQRAVFAFEHDLRDGDGSTTITTRGKPSGGYDTWMSMVGGMLDGPSLTALDTPGGTPAANHLVSYSGSWDTIQLSIDGAAWIVPGASPLTVTPNPAGGAAKQYTFRAIKNGQIVTQTVYVATPPPLPPQALISHLNTEVDDLVWNLQFNAVVGSGGGGANLTWNAFVKIGFAAEASFASGNAITFPNTQPVNRHPRSDKVVRLTVTDTVTGLTDTQRITVPSARPELNNTGNPFRNRPFDDGDYPTRSPHTTGLSVHPSTIDSRSALINAMHRTTVDTLDNVIDGAAYGKPTYTRLGYSDRAGATINASNQFIRTTLYNDSRYALQSLSSDGRQIEANNPFFSDTSAYVSSAYQRSVHTLANTLDGGSRFASPVVNATSDITLLSSGLVTLFGNDAQAGPGAVWNAQVYSPQGYFNGAHAEATVPAGAGPTMFGLNPDPLTDASYASINYAFYITNSAADLQIYESGAALGSFGTYATGDVLAVTYDGSIVKYTKNGAVLRAVYLGLAVTFYFDSSFHGNGRISNIKFLAQSPSVLNFSSQIIRGIQWNDARYSLQSSSSDGRIVETNNTYLQNTANYLSAAYQFGSHTYDNIADGATWLRVTGVNASNKINPNSTIGRGSIKGYKVNSQTLTSGSLTQLTLDNAEFTLGLGIVRSANQLSVNDPIAAFGVWAIIAQVGFAPNATGDRYVELRKNGSVIGITSVRACSNAATPTIIPVTAFQVLAYTDLIDVYIKQDSGGNLAVRVPASETFITAIHLW